MKVRSLRRLSNAALLLLLLFPAAARADKRYQADRFDVRVQLQPDGTTRVTETVAFRFEGGTFTRVSREVPLRRTDGIDVLAGSMDGTELPRGRGAGDRRLEVSRGDNRLRIAWRFPATGGTHTLALTYLVRGLVQAGDAGDLLEWAALPREHEYAIANSRITFEWPDAATLRSLAVDDELLETSAGSASVERRDIGRNRFVTLRAAFAPGTGAPRPPGWQQREAFRTQVAPVWGTIALALFAAAAAFLWFLWVRSPRPTGTEGAGAETVPRPPADEPPAIAGALMAKSGAPSARHAMAAVLHLAQRGLLRIEELPKKRWGSRQFVLRREDVHGAQAWLRPHEQAILDLVFHGKGQAEDQVEMSAVQRRLTSGSRAITRAVRQELRGAGLIDADRLRSRQRLMTAAIIVLVLGLLSLVLAIPLANQHGGWPFLLTIALGAASVVGFVLAASMRAQTDEGLRRGARWNQYGHYLERAARKKETAAPVSADALPFAVAVGAAAAYAAALKRRGAALPAWFQAASGAADEQLAAFVALMTSSAASGGSSGAGAGAGGAAGGGSSGAS